MATNVKRRYHRAWPIGITKSSREAIRVNWLHPAAKGLKYVAFFSEGISTPQQSIISLGNDSYPLTNSTWRGGGLWGNCINCEDEDDRISMPTYFLVDGEPVSIMWWEYAVSGTQTLGTGMSRWILLNDDGSDTPWQCIRQGAHALQWGPKSGSSMSYPDLKNTYALTQDMWKMFLLTSSDGGSTTSGDWNCYVDGRNQTNVTGGGSISLVTDSLNVFGDSENFDAPLCYFDLIYNWNEKLTEDDALQLYMNPFCIFEGPSNRSTKWISVPAVTSNYELNRRRREIATYI